MIPTPIFNPYQPPGADAGEVNLDAPTSVAFHTDARLRRHALDQYQLHWQPKRMLFSSLAMIFVSGVCLFASVHYGAFAFVPTMICTLIASAAIYWVLVFRTRNRILANLKASGLDSDQSMTLRWDANVCKLLRMDARLGERASRDWPNDQIRLHRTRRGLLICPEPMLCIFVPKNSDFQAGSYKNFLEIARARVKSDQSLRGSQSMQTSSREPVTAHER